jgi:hypothetical protein
MFNPEQSLYTVGQPYNKEIQVQKVSSGPGTELEAGSL